MSPMRTSNTTHSLPLFTPAVNGCRYGLVAGQTISVYTENIYHIVTLSTVCYFFKQQQIKLGSVKKLFDISVGMVSTTGDLNKRLTCSAGLKNYQDTHLPNLTPKERILQTAVHLFARQGFAGTGLRELAARAEVNLAMINYFFGSKKGLLKEILDGFFEGYLTIARKELVGTEDLPTRLARFIHSSVLYFEAEQDLLLVTITELPHDDPEIIEHKANWARQMAEIFEHEVCSALARETGRTIPPTCVGPMLTSLMASRFLFSPLIDQIGVESGELMATPLYTEMITKVFLQGITDPNWQLNSDVSNPS